MTTLDHSDTVTCTKVFKSGNSQAVRIPASLRLDTNEVKISKLADGKLLIEPILKEGTLNRGQQFLSILSEFDEDFIKALEDGENNKLPMQERNYL